MKKTVAIIGYGRFGQLLAKFVAREYEVKIIEADSKLRDVALADGYELLTFKTASHADVIILAVPTSKLEDLLLNLVPHVAPEQVVMDVCSVKVFPSKLLEHYLPGNPILGTHPLFGPDSAKDGLEGLKVVLCPLGTDQKVVEEWRGFWSRQGAQVDLATPEEHDRDAVYSQAFAYSMARMVQYANVPKLNYSTKTYDLLKEVGDISSRDSQALFHDMLYYNPFFGEMKEQMASAYAKTMGELDVIEAEQERQ